MLGFERSRYSVIKGVACLAKLLSTRKWEEPAIRKACSSRLRSQMGSIVIPTKQHKSFLEAIEIRQVFLFVLKMT